MNELRKEVTLVPSFIQSHSSRNIIGQITKHILCVKYGIVPCFYDGCIAGLNCDVGMQLSLLITHLVVNIMKIS